MHQRNYMRLLSLDSNVVQSRPGTNAVNVGGGEVWNFGTYVDGTNNHSKWLTLQRAPQLGSGGFALETVKEVQLITNAFSVEFGGHSAGVASMITKSGTNSVAGSAFFMLRPGDLDARPPLARGRRALQPAAGRRRDRRRRWCSDKAVLLRQLRVPPRAQRGGDLVGGVAGAVGGDAGRRAPGPPPARLPLQRQSTRWRVRYNMVRWQKDNETGGLNLPGTGFIWDNNVDTVHGMFTTVALVAVPERSAGPVLALHRQPRRQARRA